MRHELPPRVAALIERCDRASLVFDLEQVAANLRAIGEAARASGITSLFALKAFPHPAVIALARELVDGFDAASPAEVAQVAGARLVSIADPSGRANVADAARLIVSCETIAQVVAAPAHAEIAIRLSASGSGRDPAIGAIIEGSGHRRSRFGIDVDPAARRQAIAEMVGAANGRPIGLHVHHGPVTAATSERFVTTARGALAAAAEADLEPRFVNLGGAWHGVTELAAALREVRAAVPASIELVIEPGRAVSRGAGFACGRIASERRLDDRVLCVLELSRICHLRWSLVQLVAPAPSAGDGRATMFVGPSCFEEDVIGEWIVAPGRFVAGARAVVRDVTGYALAWNTGFGGVAPADVIT